MYDIPAELDLPLLRGAELHMINLGRYDVHFVFYTELRIVANHELVVRKDGVDVATWTQEGRWSSVAFQELLHETVSSYSVPDRSTLVMQFASGHEVVLRVDDRYESIQIHDPERPTAFIIY